MQILCKYFILAISSLFFATASYSDDQSDFERRVISVIKKLERKSDYKPIPLSTEAQLEEFFKYSFQLFTGEITKATFITELENRYSGYSESIRWQADQFMR